jgi:glucokinase
MPDSSLLIGDIGGTNARFALADRSAPAFSDVITLKCGDYESADQAIKHYLDTVHAGPVGAICLAVAGPVVDKRVRFTNNHWQISADELGRDFSIDAVRLLNDFEAIACSIPFLSAADSTQVGAPKPILLDGEHFTIGIIGPGTGLGEAGLKKIGNTMVPIGGEGSHGGFAPETQVQIDLLNVLRERFDRVSTERLVSGPGIENVYWALTRIRGEKRASLSAAEIFDAAIAGSDEIAAEAAHLFFEILGQEAGNLALTLGAQEGVYLAGGIARRYPDFLKTSPFRSAFESKGRYRSLMERIPTQLILHDQPGLLGAAYCALELIGD